MSDELRLALDIEHRLAPPRSPQTNGMVERFNGRISQVLNTHRFQSGEPLEQTLLRYVWLNNQHSPQHALTHRTPIQAKKRWQSTDPELVTKMVRDRTGPDITPRRPRAAITNNPGLNTLRPLRMS
jgi:hypothetical protein